MELLKSAKRRSRLSDVIYVILNVALAIVVFGMVFTVNNPWLPLAVVLLSKWRIFAVRPRYWWVNILSNTVDLIVTVSYVIFLYAALGVLPLQIVLLVAFIGWLLFIKPRSSRRMVSIQALVAVFTGTTSLALVAYNTNSAVFVVGMWIIGYTASRHMLSTYNDNQMSMLSLAWGFVMAELGWLAYQWLFVYSPFGTADFKLVQVALVASLLSFLAGRVIDLRANGQLRRSDLALPAIFSLGLAIALVLFFNNLNVVGSI